MDESQVKSLMTQVAGGVFALAAPEKVMPSEELLALVDRIYEAEMKSQPSE